MDRKPIDPPADGTRIGEAQRNVAKRTKAQQIGDTGEYLVGKVVSEMGHIWRPNPADYGIDGQIEARFVEEGRATLATGDPVAELAGFEAAIAVDANSADAYLGLGRALQTLERFSESRAAYERAFALCRSQGDAVGAFRAARVIAMFCGGMDGNWVLYHGWLGRAAAFLEEVGGEASLARLELLRGQHLGVPDADKEGNFLRGLALARRAGDAEAECQALAYLGNYLVHHGRLAEGMPLLDQAMTAVCAGEINDMAIADEIFCVLLAACERAHDVARADQWMRTVGEFAQRFNLKAMAALCRAHYGGLLTDAGRWAEAEQHLLAAADLFASSIKSMTGNAATRLADLRVRQGRFEEAAALLVGWEETPDATRPLAALHLERGEFSLARDRIRRALSRDDPLAGELGSLLSLLVEVELRAGDHDAARDAAARLAELARVTPVHYLVASAALARGRVCLATREGNARGCLVEALAAFSQAAMPIELARARVELARAVASDQPEVAVAEASAALRTFEESQARRDADAALAVLRLLGQGTPPRARSDSAATVGLTQREGEVLQLLSFGFSNPEIADRLYISRKTVEHHVGRILAKLGLRSRAEAAAFAARIGKGL